MGREDVTGFSLRELARLNTVEPWHDFLAHVCAYVCVFMLIEEVSSGFVSQRGLGWFGAFVGFFAFETRYAGTSFVATNIIQRLGHRTGGHLFAFFRYEGVASEFV